MTIKFNVPGNKRKELAKCIGTWLGYEVSYASAPSFAYQIGSAAIDRDGKLNTELDADTTERLLQHLYDEGFEAESLPEREAALEPTVEKPSSVIIPKNDMTEDQESNLSALIAAKANLIKKALGIENLYVAHTDETIEFPWLSHCESKDEKKAVTHFINALCEMAKNQKRINAKEKELDNEKYAFRCFLLRLGFIGDAYKAERKILLRNLTGSSAFKSGNAKQSLSRAYEEDERPEMPWDCGRHFD